MQGSHGFITQHMWASEIRAFINLEACGAGGRELVFQSGPDNPWMIEAYGMAAPHPFASVVGQEIFQGIVQLSRLSSQYAFQCYDLFCNC